MKLSILSAIIMLFLTACASTSDIERLQGYIDSVQAAADSALSTASSAQSAADEAARLADEANINASSAQSAAHEARNTANNAQDDVYGLTESLITSLQSFQERTDTSDQNKDDDRYLRLR